MQRATSNDWETLDTSAVYSFAGFWYARDPESVGGVTATSAIEDINGLAGETIDATQAISEFVSTGPSRSPEGRITIVQPLPAPSSGTRRSNRSPAPPAIKQTLEVVIPMGVLIEYPHGYREGCADGDV